MLIYRIVHKLYGGSLFASGMQGRWNSAGNKVLYAAESIPLAFLENMVRRQGVGFNNDFQIMFIFVPDTASIEEVSAANLSLTWRGPNDYSACLPPGDKWYHEAKSIALKVPSAVMPEAFNYVINTMHPDYKQVALVGTTSLIPDPGIEDILKKYR
ncbi:RES family NAD+ phosphorylase [Dyadobacter pollutisoli]|uniref:RES family NAD+ phosphorylase n=1 Tax=Dyadobacter pollutisoli TaxID=2910158 RepID=A0A9E8NDD9_9BACT|nr:RES family NAD+ phosphorylase [Dyadobacter pollutisoli]WAC12937.1 RES family NAD+ phosphorylase [Dyadobacter pollutisoli]